MIPSRIKKLGSVAHFSDIGNAIIYNPTKLPKIGSNVVNENMEHIGNVSDIFGPVKKPYVSIKLKPQFRDKIPKDSMLYIIDRKPQDVRQKKISKGKKSRK
jgi:RNA-binding protein